VFFFSQKVVEDDIVQAMNSKSLEDIQKAMLEVSNPLSSTGSDTSHALFTFHADRGTLCREGVAFRSEAVARRVLRQAVQLSRSTLIPALQSLLVCRSTRSVADIAFEVAVADVLGRGGGGTYAVRPLYGPGGQGASEASSAGTARALWQTVPVSLPMQRFGSLSELAQKCAAGEWDLRRQFFKPSSPNLAAIDFIGPGLQLFQVTANRSSHELKVTSGRSAEEGLLAVYSTLLPLLPERWSAQRPHLDVCFVVPEGCGSAWKEQRLVLHQPKGSLVAPEAALIAALQPVGGASGFSVGVREVEVRQSLMQVPGSVFDEWLALPVQPRDAIDEAAES
jgi:hypothetical protein